MTITVIDDTKLDHDHKIYLIKKRRLYETLGIEDLNEIIIPSFCDLVISSPYGTTLRYNDHNLEVNFMLKYFIEEYLAHN